MTTSFFRKMIYVSSWVVGLGLIYVPIVTLVAYSFFAGEGSGFSGPPNLTAYRDLMQDEGMHAALLTSLKIAAVSATISLLLGLCAAIAAERGRLYRRPKSSFAPVAIAATVSRKLISLMTMIPLLLPEIVFGLGLLVWFVVLRISLGTVSLILAHVTFSVSYVFLTVCARMRVFDPAVEDAAIDLGASAWQVLMRVYLPMLAPSIVSGWLMAFTLSFDDFLISFFTGGAETETLPLALYSSIRFGIKPSIFAMSSLIFGVSFISAIVLVRVIGHSGRSSKIQIITSS